MLYFLRKRGMWYAHNNAGYTARAELAEIYTKDEAKKHESPCGWDEPIRAIPIDEMFKSAEELQPYIDRMLKMQECLRTVKSEN